MWQIAHSGKVEKLEGCLALGLDLMHLQNIVYYSHSATSMYRELTCSYMYTQQDKHK